MPHPAANAARRRIRALRWLTIAAACLLAAGCTGFEPMDMPDERENPTMPGVLTGDDGEFVIYGK